MKRLALLLLLPAACAGVAPLTPPAAIRTDRVPPIPRRVFDRLAPYLEVRSTAFLDWSPDGSKILAARRFGSITQLCLVDGPGAPPRQITFFDEPVTSGFFLRDGSIVFAMSRGGDENFQLYRRTPDGEAILLTDGRSRHTLGPRSRDGTRFVFTSNARNGRDTDLFVWSEGRVEKLLEVSREFWSAVDWSPDDSKLLLRRYVSVNESYPFVMDLQTRELQAVPVPGGRAAYGAMKFAPDGKSILVATDANREFRTLARVELATHEYTWLTEDIPWDVQEIEVHGEQTAFTINEDGTTKLYLNGRCVELPMGELSGLKFYGTRLAFTLNRPDAPGDVYTYDGTLTRWTRSELGGLDPSTFVRPKRIRFRSFDDREIPAYYYPSPRPGRAPVIISIHGGPEGQYTPSFSAITQFWLNELGCAVIGPNVRGSTGYGKTYVALDNGPRRLDAVRDIGALLDWIARQPELDAQRVAVIGGSYGGYMVLASLMLYGERIRAGVDIVGIANFISFLEKTSAYRQDLRRAEYGDERDPEMRAFFREASPYFHADRIRSALLVAHGRNDPRVPVFEAEQIHQRVPGSWLVIADNEGHGFAKKENRDFLQAVIAFFFERTLQL